MNIVKGQFMRCQGNLMESQGAIRHWNFTIVFKSSRHDCNCNLGVENLFEHFENLVVRKDNECIDIVSVI